MALSVGQAIGQCSMCTKTAASLDDKSARGLNAGILYLAALPLCMMGLSVSDGGDNITSRKHHQL